MKEIKTRQAKIKNSTTNMQLDGCHDNRLDEVEEWISDIKDKFMENNESEKKETESTGSQMLN